MEHIRLYHGEQRDLAKAAGVTRSYICSIVKGRLKCPEKLAEKLEEASSGRITKAQWMGQFKGRVKDAEATAATQG